MRSSPVTSSDTATTTQYNDLRDDAYGGSMLLAHQETTPGMTVYVESGVFYLGPTKVSFAGGSSPTITAPTANPRIDLLTIDSTGTLAFVTGTEAATPAAPTYPVDKMVVAEIYNAVGETIIYDNANQTAGQGYITDVRPYLFNVAPTITDNGAQKVSTVYQNTSGRFELHIVSATVSAGDASNPASASLKFVVDSTNPPGTSNVKSELSFQSGSATVQLTSVGALVAMVPPGDYYEIISSTSGSLSYTQVTDWQTVTL